MPERNSGCTSAFKITPLGLTGLEAALLDGPVSVPAEVVVVVADAMVHLLLWNADFLKGG